MINRCVFVLLIIALAFVSITGKAFAGVWTVQKHKVYGEQYMKWNYAKEEFLADGRRRTLTDGMDARSWEFVMEPKFEFGVTDWLNALFSMEYKQSHYKEYGRPLAWGSFARKNNGVTNIKLGGKWRLMQNPFVLSTQARVIIYPGYDINHGEQFNSAQPSIGLGDDAIEWRVLAGKTFSINMTEGIKIPVFISGETGYIWRNRRVCNGYIYFLEGGFWPTKWLLLKTELDGYRGQGGTGSLGKQSYGIWRIGWVWQVFGNSTERKGKQAFNIEMQYGFPAYGKNTAAYQECILKVSAMF